MTRTIPSWPAAFLLLASLAAAPAPALPGNAQGKKGDKKPRVAHPLNYGKFRIKGGIKLPPPPPSPVNDDKNKPAAPEPATTAPN